MLLIIQTRQLRVYLKLKLNDWKVSRVWGHVIGLQLVSMARRRSSYVQTLRNKHSMRLRLSSICNKN